MMERKRKFLETITNPPACNYISLLSLMDFRKKKKSEKIQLLFYEVLSTILRGISC